jgi:dihydrofolate reductase
MRPARYNVATSLDGFIADARGGIDWIPHDATVDFAAIFAKVDTVLLGRHSYALVRTSTPPWRTGTRIFVFSTTLSPEDHPGATVINRDADAAVSALRSEPGSGEIWLFGGGTLCASLLDAGQVDSVEVTVVPVILGGGVPMTAPIAHRQSLRLLDTHTYPSGMVTLRYITVPR